MSAKQKAASAIPTTPRVEPEKISISRITMVNGHVEGSEAYLKNPKRPSQIKVDFGHRSGIDWKGGNTYSRLFVELEAQNEKSEAIGLIASYAFEFVFKVENLSGFEAKSKNGNSMIHPVLATTLMGIIFSTARGMVLERTKGTYFDGVILPVISPAALLTSWRD